MAEQSKLAPIEPMSREEIESVRELCSAVVAELQDIPHSTYVRANRYLGELRSMFEEKLPGGFFGHCEACNTILGCDDDFAIGQEDGINICADCAARYAAESISTPAQELEDA